MAYDAALAERLRDLLTGEDGVREKRMFGGLAFLVRGNLAVSASHDGGLLVRLDPADAEAALAVPHASPMEMRGRSPKGWIRVAPEGLKSEQDLASWVERSLEHVRTLPAK